ncbi:MAG: transporter substrate-binding domain-containing protein [Xanthobacteraceae bacterium]|nr:transporter substrate-binding domain-containing protein [Xanthobacteraceae bacterium]
MGRPWPAYRREIACAIQQIVYDTTETFTKSFGSGAWDVAIGPRTPIAENTSELTRPFMYVDNIYVAAPGQNLTHAKDVDRPGLRIAVVINGAPDQFLSRTLKAATLVRVAGATPQIVEILRAGQADVYGSNAENVHAAAAAIPGSRILSGAFRTVHMVVAFPKAQGDSRRQIIGAAVGDAISSGLIQCAISAAGSKGVRVAD